MQDTLLSLQHITKNFGEGDVLRDISLDVARGEFVTLLGASGCGKTTTLRIISGLETPDEGTVLLDGKDVTALPPERRPVNTVFQSYALFPHMNVEKNVAYGLRVRGMDKASIAKRVREMLELFHEATGLRRVRLYVPIGLAKAFAPLCELYYRLARRTPLYTSYSLTTLTGNANFSHAKADRALGYTVRPFRETVADTIAWLKKAKRI